VKTKNDQKRKANESNWKEGMKKELAELYMSHHLVLLEIYDGQGKQFGD